MPSNHSGNTPGTAVSVPAMNKPRFLLLGTENCQIFLIKMFSKESVDYSYSALKMHFKKINESSRLFKMYSGSREKVNVLVSESSSVYLQLKQYTLYYV